MRDPRRIRLTSAQVSALECSGILEAAEGPREAAVLAAWQGSLLIVAHEALDDVCGGLVDLANAEDASAEEGSLDPVQRRQARGACDALSNLVAKI